MCIIFIIAIYLSISIFASNSYKISECFTVIN